MSDLVASGIKKDVDKIIKNINEIDKKIVPAAIVPALNKTGRKLKTFVSTGISRSTGIPKKFINGTSAKAKTQVRGRLKLYQATRTSKNMKLWMGVYNISAASLGKVRETRGRVKVGKIVFSNAFKATMGGHTDYYQRIDGKIKKASINIRQESRYMMLKAKYRVAPKEFTKQLIQALEWKMRKYAKS